MLTVADMGEGGVKNHWKSADVLYGWSLSKTTALKHLNDFKNCKKHYTEEELSVIEKFTNEPKSIDIKKYEYDANARSKKYRDTNEYDSRKYDPEKRRQKHLQDEEKYAEELAKYQKQSRQNFDYIC